MTGYGNGLLSPRRLAAAALLSGLLALSALAYALAKGVAE